CLWAQHLSLITVATVAVPLIAVHSFKMASCSCSCDGFGCNSLYLRTFSGILKIIQIILVEVALGILRSSQYANFHGGQDAYIFGAGVLVAALIITPVLLFCYLFGRLDVGSTTILEPAINLILCVFLGISGSLAIRSWFDASKTLGAFCIGAAVAYAIDIAQRFCIR
ncbi:unnamed protein product, partial [Meganyctiphanes norvegica]